MEMAICDMEKIIVANIGKWQNEQTACRLLILPLSYVCYN